MIDLELMHNYSVATYATLSNNHMLRELWKGTVPKVGLSCDYIMQSVLAISALHIAHYNPEKRNYYVAKALSYHRLASQSAMCTMDAITPESAETLILFSILTIYIG